MLKTINIIKNYKKILKIVYFFTIFKKPSQKIFYYFYKYFIILRYFMLCDMIL